MILFLGFAGVYGLSNYLEAHRPTLPESYADADLEFEGKRLRGFALGAEGLLADWYWMRSLQYVGDKVVTAGIENLNLDDLKELDPRLLYPMLDNATTLDPKLMAAYSYGATVLPAIDPRQAIALTEKGIENNPQEWRLFQYLGYIHWRSKEFEKAADVYDRGSRIPGAPNFFRLMAARMRTESGSRDTARAMYSQMMNEAPDGQTRESARLRVLEIDSLDERDVINTELRALRERTGKCAAGLTEILPALARTRLPAGRELHIDASRNLVDPSGVPYRLDPEKCTAEIDRKRSKIPGA